MERTYITIGETIRLYSDGTIRQFVGNTPGNGSDVAPGETTLRRSRIDVATLSDADRVTLERWDADQAEQDRRAGF